MPLDDKGYNAINMEPGKKNKLGVVSGVFIPVYLNILSILMFLRFGPILGQVGLLGILGTSGCRL
jgi:solute carrier family 12 (potassium/chloride transporters), member 9